MPVLAQQLTLILKTTIMSDNKMNIGGADRRRISLDEDYEVRLGQQIWRYPRRIKKGSKAGG